MILSRHPEETIFLSPYGLLNLVTSSKQREIQEPALMTFLSRILKIIFCFDEKDEMMR